MRILHIHPSMASGGVEAMICGLANEMVMSNHQVTVCSIFIPKSTDVFWFRLSPKVNKCTLRKEKQGFSLKALFDIFQFIRKEKYDVVHVHGFFYYYLLPVLLLHNKTRFIYTVHSDARKENAKWDRRLFWLKKISFRRRWLGAVTISTATDKSFKELYGFNSYVIPNGIPKHSNIEIIDSVRQFRITPDTKVFINPARITQAKNQLVLCKVFHHLIMDGYDVVIIIAGDKQDPIIFNEIQPYFCNRIVYLGVRDDIHSLLQMCDGLCLPSIWEGLPVTLLESISLGCIPICSPVGGIPDVINDGVNGILSESSDSESYYDAMRRFLSLEADEIHNMKKKCIETFDKFDISRTAQSYISLYDKL